MLEGKRDITTGDKKTWSLEEAAAEQSSERTLQVLAFAAKMEEQQLEIMKLSNKNKALVLQNSELMSKNLQVSEECAVLVRDHQSLQRDIKVLVDAQI